MVTTAKTTATQKVDRDTVEHTAVATITRQTYDDRDTVEHTDVATTRA